MGTETLNSYTNTGIVLTPTGSYNSPFTVTTAGTIQAQAGSEAVYSQEASPYLLNEGLIAGGAGAYGIYHGGNGGIGVSLNSGTLTNTGSISGGAGSYSRNTGRTGGAGVSLNSGTITNTGSIAGGAGGDSYYFGGNGGAGINVSDAYVYNSGGITGGSGSAQGDGAVLGVNSTLVNAGMISGGAGVSATSAGYVTNSGTITGASEDGVYLGDGGTVTNTGAYGLISGGYDGVYAYNAAAYVTNSGTITGASNDGVYLCAGGTVTNMGSSALISAGSDGVFVKDAYGTVTNSGSIMGATNDGIYLAAGGTVFNAGTSALIYGTNDGIAIAYIGGGDATNAGTVIGGFDGVYLSVGAFYNTGSQALVSGSNAGVYAKFGSGLVTNAGTINGSDYAGIDLSDGGTVFNSGTVTSASRYGVYLGGAGTVTNTASNALIYGGYNGICASGATYIYNAGTIIGAGGDGINLDDGGTVINSGIISGDGTAVRFYGVDTNLIVVDPGAVFNGVVEVGLGLNILEVAGISRTALTGIGTEYTGFTQLSFASGAAWTLEGDSAGLNGDTVTGFTNADALDVGNLTYYGPQFLTAAAGGVLSVTEGAGSDSFTFSGDAGYTYTITSDGNTGTEIEEVTCFAAGTRVATARGQVKVEDLEIGDLVQTVHAGMQRIKWIGVRSYVAPFGNHKKVLPVRISAGAIADGIPSRDLFVSPGHAICIDEALIHAARLVNGRTITQLERVESVTYYHVELENHEVILAENCPAETFMGEYFRKQFHNAESFSARYPGGQAPEIACLPMLTHGFQLAAILRRLRARAGLATPASPGRLSGYVDVCSATMISGWAADTTSPDEPVRLDILHGENLIGRVIANIPRADVAAAGFGAGNHGFEFALPPGTTGPITVRRTADRTTLPHANQQSRAA